MVALVDERKIIRIAVTGKAKAVAEEWANDNDMTEIGVASRIYEWFSGQPEVVQRGILGLFGAHGPDIAKMVLEDMAAGKKPRPKAREPASGRPRPTA